jgi:hypothetical protein
LSLVPQITIPGSRFIAGEAIQINGDSIAEYVKAIYQLGAFLIALLAAVMIMYAGYRWILAGGNATVVTKSKTIIVEALIGLVIIMSSYIILRSINPALVDLPFINVPTVANPTSGGGSATNCDGCSKIDAAVNNNSSGVDPVLLKSILVGGECCSAALSSDGFGSCGYSQALPYTRTWCGISGTASETCKKVQNDVQLDINCAAKYIKEGGVGRKPDCVSTDVRVVASCYNTGRANNCAGSTLGYRDCKKGNPKINYCDRAEEYYNKCKK